jgi:hypothetical protein
MLNSWRGLKDIHNSRSRANRIKVFMLHGLAGQDALGVVVLQHLTQ